MKKVAIIGASGRVARLARAAWANASNIGESPLCIARRPALGIDIVWDALNDNVPRLDRPITSVIDFTGITPRSGGDLTQNTALALAGFKAACVNGARHLFVCSSSAVYGATDDKGALETRALTPSAPYGQAKCVMEQEISQQEAPPNITILRLGNVAGAGQPFDAVTDKAATSVGLHRFADGTGPSRSYIGAGQLAYVLSGLTTLVEQGASLPPVLNVATPTPTAMADLLEALNHPWHWVDAPASAIQHVHLDTGLLQGLCPLPIDSGTASALIADIPTLEHDI